MSIPRAFKLYTVGTTAIPVFGTTITPAITADPNNAQTVVVADSSMFLKSADQAQVVSASTFLPTEPGPVQITVVSATSIKAVFTKNHAAGDFLVLSFPCANVMVQASAATPPNGSIFLGTLQQAPNMTNTGTGCFHDLSLSLLYYGPPAFGNADNTVNYWIIAANTAQKYLPSAIIGG